jgi:hypothetical protein
MGINEAPGGIPAGAQKNEDFEKEIKIRVVTY